MAGDAPTLNGPHNPRVGSYRVLHALGSGGMSSVFRAVHAESGVEVALKILPRTLAKNPTLLQRFLREAKSAEALEHPNVVAIYDRGEDQGRHYLVLEYVAGGDLHDWVRSHGAMAIAEAVAVIRSASEGLRFAAGVGLIHRDVKPANLLIDAAGLVKVADLGLALRAESEDERMTREGTTVGTVDYMAPEQARDSHATSIRSDIYSLGCTFYFLLTGEPPYPGGDVVDKLTRHCTAPLPDLRGYRTDVPVELDRLLRRMLAKRPEQRFQDYHELIAALDTLPVLHPAGPSGPEAPLRLLGDRQDHAANGPAEVPATPIEGPTSPGRREEEFGVAEVSSTDLARLDAEDRGRVVHDPIEAGSGTTDPAAIDPRSWLFEEDESPLREAMPARIDGDSTRVMTEGERSWLLMCILIGLAVLAFIIGVHQLVRVTFGPTASIVDVVEKNFPSESSNRPREVGGSSAKIVKVLRRGLDHTDLVQSLSREKAWAELLTHLPGKTSKVRTRALVGLEPVAGS